MTYHNTKTISNIGSDNSVGRAIMRESGEEFSEPVAHRHAGRPTHAHTHTQVGHTKMFVNTVNVSVCLSS